GWRGTAANIVVETVRVMQENFGCDPQRVVAAIGPSIGKCCFEVGEEVARVFQQLFPGNQAIVGLGKQPGKYQVDLWEANRKELLACGVKNENIEVAGMCSVCHPDLFFSYRREGEKAGRFGAGIGMKS
ncbi:MAG: polyphenol oxidase family protein, partial [Odoribacter splanchnicus]